MNCCKNCFKDSQITSIIKSYCHTGNCDICGRKGVLVININDAYEIKAYLEAFAFYALTWTVFHSDVDSIMLHLDSI